MSSRTLLPQARLITTYTWPDVAIPRMPEPMRIKGHDYLLMVDEFSELAFDPTFSYRPENAAAIGRILNVDDPSKPFRVSQLRLEVQLTKNRAGDQRNDPGLRVFDISDPYRPREVASYNRPTSGGGYAMAKPQFDRPHRSVWFTDVNGGFFAVQLAKWIWPAGL